MVVNKKKQLKNLITGGVVKRTVAGGILGATAGYVADADTAKKLLTHTNLKDKGAEMARATKDKGSEVAKNLLNKHRSSLSNEEKNEVEMNAGEEELSSETEAEHEEPGSSDGYQSLAEESENINKRLGSLERKMDKLSQIIDGNGQGEADSDGSQQKDNVPEMKETNPKKNKNSSKSTKGSKKMRDNNKTDTALYSEDDTIAS